MSRVEERESNLLLKAKPPTEGYSKIIGRGEMGLKHLEFGLLRLTFGEWSCETGECEHGLDIYSGITNIESETFTYKHVGSRKNAFDGPPTAVYLPPGTSYHIQVIEGPFEAAVFSVYAPGFNGEPAVICPEDTITKTAGQDNWSREIYTSIGDNISAVKLLMGETVNPPGNWSGWPPHKHDAFNPPNEVGLEEIYYFQVNPAQGFGIIRVYTQPNDPSPMDEIYVVENGDTVVIPRGYHPVAAAPGCTLHYTWAMAGEIRKFGAVSLDPHHT